MKILQPPDWAPPRGYANGMMAEIQAGSRLLLVSGQIGWNGKCEFETDDFGDAMTPELREQEDRIRTKMEAKP